MARKIKWTGDNIEEIRKHVKAKYFELENVDGDLIVTRTETVGHYEVGDTVDCDCPLNC